MKKIKVVFIHHELVFGGAEKALYDLCCLLDKEKFDVSVFVQVPGREWDGKFREAGIELIYDYSCRKPTWNPVKKLGNLRKKLQVQKSLRNECKGLLDICCPGADIVVSYSTWGGGQIGFAENAKTVLYLHGDMSTNETLRDIMEEKKPYIGQYDRFVCVSQVAKESFCQWLGHEKNVGVIYNPMNTEQVLELAEQKVELPDDLPMICAVGRLSPEKAFERLILIHKNLLDQGILHRLVIVGDGPDRSYLERLVDATGTRDTVIMAGYQSNPYPYIKASRFVVNSSHTEGLAVIAMEALCLGVPVVATAPSIAETFGEEKCGFITENSVPALEAGIRKMLTDDAFYQEMKEGAQRQSRFFDGKRMIKEVEELLLELAE